MESTKSIEPIRHPLVQEIIEHEGKTLFELVEVFGSAVHILLPEIFQENLTLYESALKKYELKHGILYAAKANKGRSFLEMCSKASSGVDVSSIFELRSALSYGVIGENIGISGPMKTDKFLLLAVKHNSLIAIDSFDELDVLINFIKSGLINEKIRILIRIGDLQDKKSRFGIQKDQLDEIYKILDGYSDFFDLQGFSFHLDGYSIKERANAISEIYTEIVKGRDKGFNCSTIDIGGGFTISYLDENNWRLFQDINEQQKALFYQNKKFTSFYPYYSVNPKEKFLEEILNSYVQNTRTRIFELLQSGNIQLLIEPGRSLLDQAGFTVMKVRGTKSLGEENLVFVDANFNHLSEQWFNTDFIPGPLHVPKISTPMTHEQSFVASVAGNTCMENDMLTWRKVPFSRKPKKDDLLVYTNTAGYQMDSNESEFHQIPIPEKITMFKGIGNRIQWKKDSDFSQLDLL
ncbi:MAG: hypothetical protein PHU71_04155 [Candidatus Gracilibacteria bacterium]|nr:hypothetical protein [Candidatus Gracilibacteria bacterium]